MVTLTIKARELATHLLTTQIPDNCGYKYKYLSERKDCHGMTFKINMEEYPNVVEVQLTKRSAFFRDDLEVFIKLLSHRNCDGETRAIEVLNFDGKLFDKVWNAYYDKIKLKAAETKLAEDQKWFDGMNKIIRDENNER